MEPKISIKEHIRILQAVDRTLRDGRGKVKLFGEDIYLFTDTYKMDFTVSVRRKKQAFDERIKEHIDKEVKNDAPI